MSLSLRWHLKLQPTRLWVRLVYFRVYSGVYRAAIQSIIRLKDRKKVLVESFRCTRIAANEVKEVLAGDIAAAIGLKNTTTGDTLCDIDKVITLERMEFTDPVISWL